MNNIIKEINEYNDCDYRIIVIDTDTATFTNNTNLDFYVKINEPLRNVFKFNIISCLINLQNDNTTVNKNLESVYINLNNYTRIISKNNSGNDISYFEVITVETPSKTPEGSYTVIKNDYNNSYNIYMLNPIEPQLNRFNVSLYDKENTILTKTVISRVVIKLGVYYNNKKTTRI